MICFINLYNLYFKFNVDNSHHTTNIPTVNSLKLLPTGCSRQLHYTYLSHKLLGWSSEILVLKIMIPSVELLILFEY